MTGNAKRNNFLKRAGYELDRKTQITEMSKECRHTQLEAGRLENGDGFCRPQHTNQGACKRLHTPVLSPCRVAKALLRGGRERRERVLQALRGCPKPPQPDNANDPRINGKGINPNGQEVNSSKRDQ